MIKYKNPSKLSEHLKELVHIGAITGKKANKIFKFQMDKK